MDVLDPPSDLVPTTPDPESSFLLYLIFHGQLVIHFLSFGANVLLFVCLYAFSCFHVHMRIICRQLCTLFAIISLYGIAQSGTFIRDLHSNGNQNKEADSISNCTFTWVIPPYAVVMITYFLVMLILERSIATRRFCYYEYEDTGSNYNMASYLGYIPMALSSWNIVVLLANIFSGIPNQVDCELALQRQPSLLRNWPYLLLAVTFGLCAYYFKNLSAKNAEKKKEYIENNYSSLSHRYQVHENLVTCKLLFHTLATMAILCLIPQIVSIYSINVDESVTRRLTKAGMWYFFQSLPTLFFPCFFIYSDSKLGRRILAALSACTKNATRPRVTLLPVLST